GEAASRIAEIDVVVTRRKHPVADAALGRDRARRRNRTERALVAAILTALAGQRPIEIDVVAVILVARAVHGIALERVILGLQAERAALQRQFGAPGQVAFAVDASAGIDPTRAAAVGRTRALTGRSDATDVALTGRGTDLNVGRPFRPGFEHRRPG